MKMTLAQIDHRANSKALVNTILRNGFKSFKLLLEHEGCELWQLGHKGDLYINNHGLVMHEFEPGFKEKKESLIEAIEKADEKKSSAKMKNFIIEIRFEGNLDVIRRVECEDSKLQIEMFNAISLHYLFRPFERIMFYQRWNGEYIGKFFMSDEWGEHILIASAVES